MANALQWVFELSDKMSGPAKTIADNVLKVEMAVTMSVAPLDKATSSMEHMGAASQHAADHSHGFWHSLKEGVSLVHDAWEIMEKLSEKVGEFGREVMGEWKFKQQSLLALETLTGSRDKAKEIFEQQEVFAWKTGQNIQAIMATTKDLLDSGLNADEVRTMQQLLGDVSLIATPEKAQALAGAIADIGRRGSMTEKQMRGLADAGLDMNLLFGELGKRFPLKVDKDLGLNASVDKAGVVEQQIGKMKTLKFAADGAIASIAAVMRTKYSEGVAGSKVMKYAESMPAAIERVMSLPKMMLSVLAGADAGSGDSVIAHILNNISEAFDPAGEHGERILGRIRGLVERILGMFGITGGPGGLFAELAGPEGPAKVEEIFNSMITAIEGALPTIQAVGHAIVEIAKSIVSVKEAIDDVKSVTGWLPQWSSLATGGVQIPSISDFRALNAPIVGPGGMFDTNTPAQATQPESTPARMRAIQYQMVGGMLGGGAGKSTTNNIELHVHSNATDPHQVGKEVKDQVDLFAVDWEHMALSGAN